jgi:4'-phosphopantetheinyl transferase
MNPRRRDYLSEHMIVWSARVSQANDSLTLLESCLDDRDRERAARFRFPEDRARFVLGRALTRKCLGHYLQLRPESIELATTDRGRPFFPHDETVQFSISHTHDLVAVALTGDARIGLDLEYVNPHVELPELAKRIFCEADLQTFLALPNGERLPAFFRAWTRKEAYLKARGEGIAEKLQEISVSFGPEETVSVRDGRDPSAAETWHLRTLPVPDGYAGTLACDDPGKRLEGAFVHLSKGEIITNLSPSFS